MSPQAASSFVASLDAKARAALKAHASRTVEALALLDAVEAIERRDGLRVHENAAGEVLAEVTGARVRMVSLSSALVALGKRVR